MRIVLLDFRLVPGIQHGLNQSRGLPACQIEQVIFILTRKLTHSTLSHPIFIVWYMYYITNHNSYISSFTIIINASLPTVDKINLI